jgi:hypothetical protein
VVEVVVAGAILALVTVGLIGAFDYFSRAVFSSSLRARAVFLAAGGLEAARNLNSENFSNLVDGPHGISTAGTQWSFVGVNDVVDVFTRSITISTVDVNTKQVVSTVNWGSGFFPGSVSLVTYLTKWNNITTTFTCATYCQSLGSYTTGTCRQSATQCRNRGEINEAGGNQYCTVNPNKTCCCRP